MWLHNRDSSNFSRNFISGFVPSLSNFINLIFFISILILMVPANSASATKSAAINPSVVNVYGMKMNSNDTALGKITLAGKMGVNGDMTNAGKVAPITTTTQFPIFDSNITIKEVNDTVNAVDNMLTKEIESADVIANIILAVILVTIIALPLRKQKRITFVNVPNNREYDLSNLSFKLRTNLNGITGFANIAQGRMTGENLEGPKELIGKILSESNQMLSDLVKMEAECVNERVNRDKLSALSFQCRTSLNNILGFSGLIRDGRLGEIPDDQKARMGYIMHGSKAMLQAIPSD